MLRCGGPNQSSHNDWPAHSLARSEIDRLCTEISSQPSYRHLDDQAENERLIQQNQDELSDLVELQALFMNTVLSAGNLRWSGPVQEHFYSFK